MFVLIDDLLSNSLWLKQYYWFWKMVIIVACLWFKTKERKLFITITIYIAIRVSLLVFDQILSAKWSSLIVAYSLSGGAGISHYFIISRIMCIFLKILVLCSVHTSKYPIMFLVVIQVSCGSLKFITISCSLLLMNVKKNCNCNKDKNHSFENIVKYCENIL